MQHWNGRHDEQKLDSRCEHELDALGLRASLGEAPAGSEERCDRFEPITVRAAARVLQLQRAGVVSAHEARFYLRELVTMDLHAGPGALRRLTHLAQRHTATRPTTSATGSAPERRQTVRPATQARASLQLPTAA